MRNPSSIVSLFLVVASFAIGGCGAGAVTTTGEQDPGLTEENVALSDNSPREGFSTTIDTQKKITGLAETTVDNQITTTRIDSPRLIVVQPASRPGR